MSHPHRRLLTRIATTAALALSLPHAAAVAQSPAPSAQAATSNGALPATVRGIVYDSLAGAPLAEAVVQLVTADGSGTFGKTVNADERGQFVFDSVPDGRYALGFFHPILDSLGIEPPLRSVQVTGQRLVVVGTGIPAAATFRASVCGRTGAQQGNAVLVGFVRDARSREVMPGATVSVSWLEMSIGAGGTRSHTVRRTTTARENGWFSLCEVPSPGTIAVMAHRGADSTDMVELQVPAAGFLRRELSIGHARLVASAPATAPATAPAKAPAAPDSARAPRRIQRTGDGTLSGIVLGTATGGQAPRPLADAQVGLASGPQTRTNARGEWSLADLPAGTRMLEVRAVGYYPDRRAVDVVADAKPYTVALVTFKSVLDTMKVRAGGNGFTSGGFLERRQSGIGSFFTATDMPVRAALAASDMFRHIGGLFLEFPSAGDMDGGEIPMGLNASEMAVLMRSGAGVRCAPTFFINGAVLQNLTANDLNAFLLPSEVVGIEVYRPGQVPQQFQPPMGTCGSVVIWTRQSSPPRR
jgi:hypothetical protein